MAIKQVLTFTLANEQYAVDVMQVREVLTTMPMTGIPGMPAYLKGVINIRGSVVPVVDLRSKFKLPEIENTVDTSIIVLDVQFKDAEAEGELITVGCLVDSVQEVINIADEDIEPPPALGNTIDAPFISGLGKRDSQFVIILNVNRIFQSEDLAAIAAAEAV